MDEILDFSAIDSRTQVAPYSLRNEATEDLSYFLSEVEKYQQFAQFDLPPIRTQAFSGFQRFEGISVAGLLALQRLSREGASRTSPKTIVSAPLIDFRYPLGLMVEETAANALDNQCKGRTQIVPLLPDTRPRTPVVVRSTPGTPLMGNNNQYPMLSKGIDDNISFVAPMKPLPFSRSQTAKLVNSTPIACVHCKASHSACDMQRPCLRCIRLGKIETCVNATAKKRGRPHIHGQKQAKKRIGVRKFTRTNSKSTLIKPVPQLATPPSSSVDLASVGRNAPSPLDSSWLLPSPTSNFACNSLSSSLLMDAPFSQALETAVGDLDFSNFSDPSQLNGFLPSPSASETSNMFCSYTLFDDAHNDLGEFNSSGVSENQIIEDHPILAALRAVSALSQKNGVA
jgi:hypothetical protein